MNKIISSFLLSSLLFGATPGYAGDFIIWAKSMYPGSGVAGCTLKTPIRKCCTDYTSTTCSEQGCIDSSNCVTGGNLTCSVLMGDTGRRCCLDSTPTSCLAPERLCVTNTQCVGQAGNTVCADRYPGGSEVPGARWECDDTSAPSLFMLTKFPEELTSANQIRCRPFWNTRGDSGNFVYNLRAVAINTATSAAVPGLTFSQATDAGDLNFSYRRHIGPFTSMFSVEDESTGVACSGSVCKGKLLKIELNIDATSSLQTAGGPEYPRIRALHCNYN